MNSEDTSPAQNSVPNQPNAPTHDYTQPVAYDTNGRPLYAHPPQAAAAQQPAATVTPQVVHLARPMDPVAPHISERAKARHEESVRKYPNLNLSDGEYIISAVRRHPIGLLPIFGVFAFTAILLATGVALYSTSDFSASSLPDTSVVAVIALLIMALIGMGCFIAYYIYINNKFFLTNESVIQEIQVSLFSKHEQTVSLANIEDASYQQRGILEHLFNYGSIRLSTEGDETTYRFSFVAHPKKHIAVLNNAVEAFKNGRPVEDLFDN